MAYCHECGAEVAENDVFCPHCGISRQPIAVSETDGEVGDLMEKTIAGNLTDFQPPANENKSVEIKDTPKTIENLGNTSESVDVSPNEIPDTDISDEKEVEPEIAEKTLSENAVDKFSNAGDVFDEDEFSLDLLDFSDDVEDEHSSETSFDSESGELEKNEIADEPVFKSSTGKIPALKAETSEDKDENPEAVNESSMMSYDETEIKEKLEIEEVAEDEKISNQNAENKALDNNLDFQETLQYVPADSTSSKISGEAASEDEDAPADDIQKPFTELESVETAPKKSEFDSVKIFANQDSAREIPNKNPAEQVDFQQTESAKMELEEAGQVARNGESGEPKNLSLTRPNLGEGDTDGKNQGKLKPLEEGTVLNGRYEIVRKIGGGGMGAVYLASDKNLGGVLRAVKEMVQSYIEEAQQEKAVGDFKRESMLLTSLEHQGIPTIYDYFYDEKEARFYLVMKYISGGDLAARLRSAPEGRIDEKTVTEWAIQVAEVLEYLHNRQPPIVYRDLKPANVMIDGNSGRIMLIDFGIARWINKEEKGVTAVGTMGYAPPELFSGNVEPRSDIYSLGSTMFHLLTGADPQSNPLLIFDFQKNPKPRQINPQLSDQMEKILMQTVEYNAEKRYSSAYHLKTELQKHLENLKAGNVSYGISKSPHAVAFSDEPVFCGFCGQRIVATDLFCAFCGAKQPIASKGVHSENYAKQSLTAKLMILGTNELESPSYNLEKDDNLVGRRDPISNIFPEVDLSKFDPQTKISRKHARIWRDGKNYLLEDLGSSNGTLIVPIISDTVRLQPNQPHVLSNGDKIKIGDTTLHFVLG